LPPPLCQSHVLCGHDFAFGWDIQGRINCNDGTE
jgi:hypothetical protein